MKFDFETSSQASPLKLIGKRALIILQMLPFMHMLSPLTLTLATLRNPPGLIYPRKIFNVLKKVLLKRTFKRRYFKNEQKMKFLIRGYELLKKQRQSGEYSTLKTTKPKISFIFNLNSVKEWFDSINQSSNDLKYISFPDSIPIILQNRRSFEYRACLRLKKTITQILDYERKKQYEKCENIYKKKFLSLSIPWTENIYQEVEEFGKELWERYLKNELFYNEKKKTNPSGKKKTIIKK